MNNTRASKLHADLIYKLLGQPNKSQCYSITATCAANELSKLNRDWLNHFFSYQESQGQGAPILGVETLPYEASNSTRLAPSVIEASNRLFHQSQVQVWNTNDWIEAWRSTQGRAIKQSIGKTNKVAIMLSSGIDSAGIAAHLNQHLKQQPDIQLKAFSWRFLHHPQADESEAISRIVNYLKVDHEFIDIEDAECFTDINSWPMAFDAPYFNAMRRIKSRLYERVAEQGYEILLNGHIGDELAYVDRYYFSELWRDKRMGCISEVLATGLKQGVKCFKDPAIRYWVKRLIKRKDKAFFPDHLTDQCMNRLQAEQNSVEAFLQTLAENKIRKEQFSGLMTDSELNASAVESFYTKPYGIQRIHPYLNEELIALALASPAYLLSTPQHTKWLARKALTGVLPNDIIWQPRIGQLDSLFEEGLDKNSEEIREYLFKDQRLWQHFIDESELKNVLDNRLWNKAAAILVPCIGFERWLDVWRENGQPLSL